MHRGRVLDFHSLRHTTASLLAASGAHPNVAQSVLRHSTITLTMDTYTHSQAGAERAAVAALPEFKATGTDGKLCARLLAHDGRETTAQPGKSELNAAAMAESGNASTRTAEGVSSRSAEGSAWLPGEDSNLERRTQNPLCYHYTTGQRDQ